MTFRLKIIFVFTVLIVFITVLFSVYVFKSFQIELKKQIVKNFTAVAETAGGFFYSFVESMRTRASDWSSDGYIRNATERILSAPNISARASFVQDLNSYLRDKKIILDPTVIIVDILDKNGIVIASSREERLGADEGTAEKKYATNKFSQAISSEKFGETFINMAVAEADESSEPMTHTVTRLFSAQSNKPLPAVMLLHFTRNKQLADSLSGAWAARGGTSAEIYLVNDQELMVTPARLQKVDTEPVKNCLQGSRKTAGEYLDYLNQPVFGASVCLKEYNLTLVAEVRKSEIFASLDQIRNKIFESIFIIELASILMIVLISFLLLRSLARLTAAAERVLGGDFDVRVGKYSGDEIGRLSRIFDKMLDNILTSEQQMKQAEKQLQETNVLLDQGVAERSKEIQDLRDSLEREVAERTKNLEEKIAELEKFKELTVGRELKMIELKKKLEEIKKSAE